MDKYEVTVSLPSRQTVKIIVNAPNASVATEMLECQYGKGSVIVASRYYG